MDTTIIVIIVVVVVVIAAVIIGAYIWTKKKQDQLERIIDDAKDKLGQKYTEDQVTQILEPLENYVNPVAIQLAVDLYLQYDDLEGVTGIVNDLGKWPDEEIVQQVQTLSSGIDDFDHFEIACHVAAPRRSAEEKVQLANKYQNLETFKKILGFEVWVGQTEEQLSDSLGEPLAVDEKVLKTKTKYVWKYDRLGENRYGTRVTIENGVVAGYDIKG